MPQRETLLSFLNLVLLLYPFYIVFALILGSYLGLQAYKADVLITERSKWIGLKYITKYFFKRSIWFILGGIVLAFSSSALIHIFLFDIFKPSNWEIVVNQTKDSSIFLKQAELAGAITVTIFSFSGVFLTASAGYQPFIRIAKILLIIGVIYLLLNFYIVKFIF